MKKAGALLGMLAAFGMMGDLPLSLPTRRYVITNGHTALGNNKEPKVKRWRAKERRAKKARKINYLP